jgi:hypothetical protein
VRLPGVPTAVLSPEDAPSQIPGGRLIEHDNSRREGPHTLFWNGMNDSGSRVASGVHFYRINAGFDVRTQRLAVLK